MDEPVAIRRAEPGDLGQLAPLRHALWPDGSLEEHARELDALLSGRAPGSLPSMVLVAEESGGRLVGFLEAGLRSHADGCNPAQPVGFIEGWYVAPDWRRQRVGARLVAAAEDWARERGSVEIASDTWIDHLEAQRAHEALGFEIVDRCVHYRKPL